MILAQKSIEFINLGILLENLKKGIAIGDFVIAFYGIIIAIGIMAGMYVAFSEAKKTGQDVDFYIDFAIIVIIACVIGARLYYVAFEWEYYSNHLLEIVNIREGGLAIYGAVIAGAVTAFIYGKIKKYSFGLIGDTAVLGLITGQIIGRWGNFFNREAFGRAVGDDNLFAMRIYFDDYYSISEVPQSVLDGMKEITGKTAEVLGYIQVEPTFLYESCWNLVVLLVILFLRKYKKFNGEVICMYLLGYGMGRFVIEGMRTDQLIIKLTGWPVSQALSAVLVVISLVIIVAGRVIVNKRKKISSEPLA